MKKAALWVVLLMLGPTIALLVFTPEIIRVFNADPELVRIAVPGLRIFCSTLCLIGPTIVVITTFQGLSKGRDAWILSLIRQLVFMIPAIYILPSFLGLTGVWMAMPVSDVLAAFTAGFWIFREYRQHVKKGYMVKTASKAASPAED